LAQRQYPEGLSGSLTNPDAGTFQTSGPVTIMVVAAPKRVFGAAIFRTGFRHRKVFSRHLAQMHNLGCELIQPSMCQATTLKSRIDGGIRLVS